MRKTEKSKGRAAATRNPRRAPRKILGLAALGLCLAPLAAADEPAAYEPGAELASYRAPVHSSEIEAWRATQDRRTRAPAGSKPEVSEINGLILTKALAAEARLLGIDREPEIRLEIAGRHSGIYETAIKRALRRESRPKDAEVEAKFQEMRGTFTLPQRWRIRNLSRGYPPSASAQ
ncbi:MAG: hypothetical protein AAF725_10440 [Acidobacteriota bacterium]